MEITIEEKYKFQRIFWGKYKLVDNIFDATKKFGQFLGWIQLSFGDKQIWENILGELQISEKGFI